VKWDPTFLKPKMSNLVLSCICAKREVGNVLLQKILAVLGFTTANGEPIIRALIFAAKMLN
jgi:hypothetical protein